MPLKLVPLVSSSRANLKKVFEDPRIFNHTTFGSPSKTPEVAQFEILKVWSPNHSFIIFNDGVPFGVAGLSSLDFIKS